MSCYIFTFLYLFKVLNLLNWFELNGPVFLNTSSIDIKASDCVQGLDDKYEKHIQKCWTNIFNIMVVGSIPREHMN